MEKFEKTENKYLYKYFSINEFLFRNLINNELFFANPLQFNDPFDCQFELDLIEGSEAEQSLIAKMELSDEELEHFKQTNGRTKLSKGLAPKFYEELLTRIGVACFTEHPDNFLMWSHYADSHKGICLKFDWQVQPKFFQGTKVIYDNKLPLAEYKTDQGFQDEIPRIVITKLEHWDYEDEVRSVISLNDDKRNISFNPDALAGIIFGDKIQEHNKKLIRRIVELHGEYNNAKFFQSKLNRAESRVNIHEYY